MFNTIKNTIASIAIAAATLISATSANAAGDAKGIWIDHTGRGAVEITDCNGKLCGRIVWVKADQPQEACGKKVLGDVANVGAGKWDNGWIYDPEFDMEFDVELTPLADGTLQVMGYAGIKALSETMIWKPAPQDLKVCAVGGVASK